MKYRALSSVVPALVVVLVGLLTGQALAVDIVITDVGTTPMTPDQLAAFEKGAQDWEAKLGDPITISINVGFDDLGLGVLGSALTARTTHSYAAVRAAMLADALGALEQGALNALPTGSLPIEDINGLRSAQTMTIATANAKALGLGAAPDPSYYYPGADAEIMFNTDFMSSFDYDPSDGVSSGKQCFVTVARHEIGHALGFLSMTDLQDHYSVYTLHPSTLDLWRFFETGADHLLDSEPRYVTAGAAEYYDSVMNNVPMSFGMEAFDPACGGPPGGYCQASHWSDSLSLLMAPTLAPGIEVLICKPDAHAIDYIGYELKVAWPRFEAPRAIDLEWVYIWEKLPNPDPPPDWANFQSIWRMDLGELGGQVAYGYAQFAPGHSISPEVIEALPPIKEEMNHYPEGEVITYKPNTLHEMTFITDGRNGVRFRFTATCGINGCELDPSIGAHGGYRVPGLLDGLGDRGEESDVDGRLTMLLLADESGMPNPRARNVFKIDPEMSDNAIEIIDRAAFGLD